MSTGDENHWDLLEELERKVVERFQLLLNRRDSREITPIEYKTALETLLWMAGGLIPDGELIDGLRFEISKHKDAERVSLARSAAGALVFVVGGDDDNFAIARSGPIANKQVDQTELATGYSYIVNKMEAEGWRIK